jgi:hypothetical protein
MGIAKRLLLIIFVPLYLLVGIQGKSLAENPGQFKKMLLKFRAFSIMPGEKIVGTLVTVSNGKITYVYVPRGWSWQYSGIPGYKHIIHCFSPNSSYAVTATGMLPEVSISDMSSLKGKPLNIEASIEIEGEDGKEYSRQMQESELNIQ